MVDTGAEERKAQEVAARRREETAEYVRAVGGLIVSALFLLLLFMPVLFAVLGFSVRLYRWASGY